MGKVITILWADSWLKAGDAMSRLHWNWCSWAYLSDSLTDDVCLQCAVETRVISTFISFAVGLDISWIFRFPPRLSIMFSNFMILSSVIMFASICVYTAAHIVHTIYAFAISKRNSTHHFASPSVCGNKRQRKKPSNNAYHVQMHRTQTTNKSLWYDEHTNYTHKANWLDYRQSFRKWFQQHKKNFFPDNIFFFRRRQKTTFYWNEIKLKICTFHTRQTGIDCLTTTMEKKEFDDNDKKFWWLHVQHYDVGMEERRRWLKESQKKTTSNVPFRNDKSNHIKCQFMDYEERVSMEKMALINIFFLRPRNSQVRTFRYW